MSKPKNAESKSQTQATQDRRRSNASGTHADRRTKRLRTRAARDKASKKEWD